MSNHQCILEETEKESQFTNCDIFAYVKDGKYPGDYTKDENLNGVVVNAIEFNTGHLATCSSINTLICRIVATSLRYT